MGKYEVKMLHAGYSRIVGDVMEANCTCALITGPEGFVAVVDTMTAWDGESLKQALSAQGLGCDQVTHVVCTHGHSDHVGCNYLFLNAEHVVGKAVSRKDKYDMNAEFPYYLKKEGGDCGGPKVVETPGHTLDSVSVIVDTCGSDGVVALAGDTFEREEDVWDQSIWRDAGSEDPQKQMSSRLYLAESCDIIFPGHGPPFKVTERHRKKLREEEKEALKSKSSL